MREVLELCEQMRLESHGAFDITVGANADLRAPAGTGAPRSVGTRQGLGGRRAGQMLRDAGASNFSVNAGGDLVASRASARTRAAGWRVGVQHPWERDRVAAVLDITDRGGRDLGSLRAR